MEEAPERPKTLTSLRNRTGVAFGVTAYGLRPGRGLLSFLSVESSAYSPTAPVAGNVSFTVSAASAASGLSLISRSEGVGYASLVNAKDGSLEEELEGR